MPKPSELQSLIGTEVGVSSWIEIDQARIDAFAEVTNDHQFIHVEPRTGQDRPRSAPPSRTAS